jgi:hypothetical protein
MGNFMGSPSTGFGSIDSGITVWPVSPGSHYYNYNYNCSTATYQDISQRGAQADADTAGRSALGRSPQQGNLQSALWHASLR